MNAISFLLMKLPPRRRFDLQEPHCADKTPQPIAPYITTFLNSGCRHENPPEYIGCRSI
jgi:hypothetical protein